MNKLFKQGILEVNIEVKGETDDYIVTISYGDFIEQLRRQLKRESTGEANLRTFVRALTSSFDSEDVYIHCSCPDWKYRMDYWATMNQINSGNPQTIPSNITNPNDQLGPGCKHVMLVLSNNSWVLKVASVVNNYVTYFKKHRQRQYADIIYPALYDKEFEDVVQLDIYGDEMDTDETTIDTSNEMGRTRGRFKKQSEYESGGQEDQPKRFRRNPNQQQIDIEVSEEDSDE